MKRKPKTDTELLDWLEKRQLSTCPQYGLYGRVVGFTVYSFTFEYWSAKSLRTAIRRAIAKEKR